MMETRPTLLDRVKEILREYEKLELKRSIQMMGWRNYCDERSSNVIRK